MQDAIIEAGIRRVVVGCLDPNPEAAGGVDRLRSAGIEVDIVHQPRPGQHLTRGGGSPSKSSLRSLVRKSSDLLLPPPRGRRRNPP